MFFRLALPVTFASDVPLASVACLAGDRLGLIDHLGQVDHAGIGLLEAGDALAHRVQQRVEVRRGRSATWR